MEKSDEIPKEFLSSVNMDVSEIDFASTVDVFLEEMEKGIGGRSSLPMIPTFIEASGAIPPYTSTIVLDMGGTHFRTALVESDKDGTLAVTKLNTFPMPGSKRSITKEAFFEEIVQKIKNLEAKAVAIGFSFGYEAEILPNQDGRVLSLSKEIEIEGIEGQLIGENIRLIFGNQKPGNDCHIVILNDTTATLLAARAHCRSKQGANYIGAVLGTGFNCCYIEKNANINKISGLDPMGYQIINIESGSFARAQRGLLDLEFDAGTKNPGFHSFEKMLSGAYFGPLCHAVLISAAEQKLFSPRIGAQLFSSQQPTTREVSNFLASLTEHTALGTIFLPEKKDWTLAIAIIERLTERSAKFTSIAIAAAVLKEKQALQEKKEVIISCDGSVFYGLKNYKERVEMYLKKYLTEKCNIFFSLVKIENAPIIGAAVAALTN
jgi:hexokinase